MDACIEDFWESCETLVLGNPATKFEPERIASACEQLDVCGNIILQTSGTTGKSRWVILSRDAIRGSARAVNSHLGITEDDTWFCALPVFHTGGLAIHVRAREAGSSVISYSSHWDPHLFTEQCRTSGATICSLVPTQIFDLVASSLTAPEALRIVLVGGAPLDYKLRDKARSLGWPVRETYGMTETASQVATQLSKDGEMEILECWDVRIGNDSQLEIRGENLFSGYLHEDSASWSLLRAKDENGWFVTGDRMFLTGRTLQFRGRNDTMLKILGESVELDRLQARIESLAGESFAITAIPDERRGWRIILVAGDGASVDDVMRLYNNSSLAIERASGLVRVDEIPRTALGKLCREKLDQLLMDAQHE
jgi:O-succinylbenzoic acid--CoA ligase